MTTRWVRFSHAGMTGFGTLAGETVAVHSGDMFGGAAPTGQSLPLAEVKLLSPVLPGKIIALWNNFHALGRKLNLGPPPEPLYLLKSIGAVLAPEGTIVQPPQVGKVVFEGELGIVIGKVCKAVSPADAPAHVFGYTCGNDVTAAEILNRDPTFAQWARAKGYDTFCPLGPVIATGLNPGTLTVRTLLNGEVRQDYPISDMVFPVPELVSRLSHDMTLNPGDVILCGTSVGVGSMKSGSRVEVEIEGIGRLGNSFE
jgi:2-keto-4-pentenoate hydratase/2-oxohepta-3-ene-1,7-dioic acid hydratase in catechol pathway